MDEIKVLIEEIGIKEVSNRTHIEIKHINYIIDKDFDKLNRVNALGFVKILSREFDINMDDWVEEAERYWKENKESNEDTKIFIAQKPSVFPKILTTLLSIIVLVGILYGAYLFLDKKLDFFQKNSSNDINYTYEETPVVKEARENLKEENITKEVMVIDENLNEKNITSTIKQESQQEETKNNINDKNNTAIEIEGKMENQDTNVTTKVSILKKATITPNVKLWVGVIYLDDGSRDSYLGDGNFTIDLSREQLITTGHGNFTIHFDNGKIEEFKEQAPLKFIVKDGNISKISVEEFKRLNKGNLW